MNQPIYEPLDLEHERAKNWLNNYIYKIKRPRQTLRIIEKFQHIDPALLSELSAIGNNLNQIARQVNTVESDIEKLRAFAELAVIREQLQGILANYDR